MWDTYHAPASVAEALRLLARYGSRARIIAGGTDLLVELRLSAPRDLVLVDVTRIDGLDGIRLDDKGWIHMGPIVTHNQAMASEQLVDRGFPLALCCWLVGTPQLRNRGTLVGNLVTASPANDTITALCSLGAYLTLCSVRGERVIALAGFYRGVRRTDLAPDEMVTDLAFPALEANQRGTFAKLGLRRSHAIALVNVAAVLAFDGDLVSHASIALGSVAPTIVRASRAESYLVGGALTGERIARAADLAARVAAPIDDIRAGAGYRRNVVRVLARRALVALRDDTAKAEFPTDPPKLWGESDGRFPQVTRKLVTHHRDGPEAIECIVNGQRVAVQGAGGKTLLAMLRDDLGLTGTKEGCAEGECGACTVWVDGIAVLACLVPAPRAHGTEVVTVEGLARGDSLHPVQQAFIDEGAVQCGYCTPGFIMAGANLLQETRTPTHEQIVAGLSGNLCRCTGYYKIVRAVERAAAREDSQTAGGPA